ncbi:MAG: glycosyltransferase [Candidatus Cloacimonetes bacterium]|nr:glycosyltransferase [Candidatus Cloacimonadota bacterium]
MKQILYVTYFFPPSGGSTSQRRLKYAKYLPRFGISPVVLTVKPIHYFAADANSLRELPSSVKVYRTESFDLNRLLHLFQRLIFLFHKSSGKNELTVQPIIFSESLKRLVRSFIPIDEKIGWMPFCFIKSLRIIKKLRIDAIMVSLVPYHSAITAWLLSKVSSIPFILEYGDLWNLAPYPLYRNLAFKVLSEWIERRILKDVSYIGVTTPTAKEKMLEKYPFLKGKIDILYYGWDEEDFLRIDGKKLEPHKAIKIGYAGTFHGYQTPRHFLDAFSQLLNKKQIDINDFELHFWGNYSGRIKSFFGKSPINKMIHCHPYLTHRECLAFLKQMDYLVIFLGGGEKSNAVIPAKLFDYFALKVPIIGFTHKGGDLWNILEKYGFSLAEFDDTEDNMSLILNLLKKKPTIILTDQELMLYEKKVICFRLATEIKKIVIQENLK